MSRFILLFRGINVSGHNSLKMKDLQGLLVDLGFEKVRTYLQSGNAVLEASAQSAGKLAEQVENALLVRTKLKVPVLARKVAELGKIESENPFLGKRGVDPAHLHVTFLAEKPAAAAVKTLAAIDAGQDMLAVRGTEVYLHCPDGYGKTKLSNTRIEKALAVPATTRNWRTVSQLRRMAED